VPAGRSRSNVSRRVAGRGRGWRSFWIRVPAEQKDAEALARPRRVKELARILETHTTTRPFELTADQPLAGGRRQRRARAGAARVPGGGGRQVGWVAPPPGDPAGRGRPADSCPQRAESWYTELASEIPSADRIDIIMAFVRWAGVRMLAEPLRGRRRARGADPGAHDDVHRLDSAPRPWIGSSVRPRRTVAVSYETQATRLHAKAWLFGRDSGFDTAYVGSSNLTSVGAG
jgi:hypothetical protein